jgi:hypothetical protein
VDLVKRMGKNIEKPNNRYTCYPFANEVLSNPTFIATIDFLDKKIDKDNPEKNLNNGGGFNTINEIICSGIFERFLHCNTGQNAGFNDIVPQTEAEILVHQQRDDEIYKTGEKDLFYYLGLNISVALEQTKFNQNQQWVDTDNESVKLAPYKQLFELTKGKDIDATGLIGTSVGNFSGWPRIGWNQKNNSSQTIFNTVDWQLVNLMLTRENAIKEQTTKMIELEKGTMYDVSGDYQELRQQYPTIKSAIQEINKEIKKRLGIQQSLFNYEQNFDIKFWKKFSKKYIDSIKGVIDSQCFDLAAFLWKEYVKDQLKNLYNNEQATQMIKELDKDLDLKDEEGDFDYFNYISNKTKKLLDSIINQNPKPNQSQEDFKNKIKFFNDCLYDKGKGMAKTVTQIYELDKKGFIEKYKKFLKETPLSDNKPDPRLEIINIPVKNDQQQQMQEDVIKITSAEFNKIFPQNESAKMAAQFLKTKDFLTAFEPKLLDDILGDIKKDFNNLLLIKKYQDSKTEENLDTLIKKGLYNKNEQEGVTISINGEDAQNLATSDDLMMLMVDQQQIKSILGNLDQYNNAQDLTENQILDIRQTFVNKKTMPSQNLESLYKKIAEIIKTKAKKIITTDEQKIKRQIMGNGIKLSEINKLFTGCSFVTYNFMSTKIKEHAQNQNPYAKLEIKQLVDMINKNSQKLQEFERLKKLSKPFDPNAEYAKNKISARMLEEYINKSYPHIWDLRILFGHLQQELGLAEFKKQYPDIYKTATYQFEKAYGQFFKLDSHSLPVAFKDDPKDIAKKIMQMGGYMTKGYKNLFPNTDEIKQNNDRFKQKIDPLKQEYELYVNQSQTNTGKSLAEQFFVKNIVRKKDNDHVLLFLTGQIAPVGRNPKATKSIDIEIVKQALRGIILDEGKNIFNNGKEILIHRISSHIKELTEFFDKQSIIQGQYANIINELENDQTIINAQLLAKIQIIELHKIDITGLQTAPSIVKKLQNRIDKIEEDEKPYTIATINHNCRLLGIVDKLNEQ